MKFVPFGDNVLVRPVRDTHVGSILMPDIVAERSRRYEVLAVGPGRTNEAGEVLTPFVKVGDTILAEYIGTVVMIDDQEAMVLSERNILGAFRV